MSSNPSSSSLTVAAGTNDSGHLRSGVISAKQALFFGMSGVAIPVNLQATGGNLAFSSGLNSWLAVLIGGAVALLLGWIVIRFASRHVATGTLMSYVTLEAGPRAGVATGAALLVGYIAAPALFACWAVLFLTSFLAGCGLHITNTWEHVGLGLLVIAICVALARRGVTVSVKTAIFLGWVGLPFILITLAFALAANGLPVAPQLDFSGLNFPTFMAGVVLAFATFTGFEGFTALARETAEPQRTMPRLVLILLLVMAATLLVSVVLTSPIMAANIDALLAGSSPLSVLATVGGVPVLGTIGDALLFLAVLGALLVYVNDAGRIVGTAAKDGILPSPLAQIHPKYRTPARATTFIGTIGAVGFAGYVFLANEPIYTAFLAFAVFLTYAWTIAYILLALAGLKSAVREGDPLFGVASVVAAVAAAATLVIALAQSTASGIQALLPWISMALILVLAVIGVMRVGRQQAPDPASEIL